MNKKSLNPDRVHSSPTRRAAWPDRLIALGTTPLDRSTESERGELWLLLNTVLLRRIRFESHRTGAIDAEEIEDLASEKSLELMNKLDDGRWNLATSSRENVIAFIATVARNGLIDWLRRKGRRATQSKADVESSGELPIPAHTTPDAQVQRTAFAAAMVTCANKLQPQHRRVWMLRVFLSLSTKRIARHPEVNLKPGHIDVILQRCRDNVRECMRDAGYSADDVVPGTFTALWRAFRLDELDIAERIND